MYHTSFYCNVSLALEDETKEVRLFKVYSKESVIYFSGGFCLKLFYVVFGSKRLSPHD